MRAEAAGAAHGDGVLRRQAWEPMKIEYLGQVGALMRGNAGTTRDGLGENCATVDKRNRPCNS
jgi:hypothetical protein